MTKNDLTPLKQKLIDFAAQSILFRVPNDDFIAAYLVLYELDKYEINLPDGFEVYDALQDLTPQQLYLEITNIASNAEGLINSLLFTLKTEMVKRATKGEYDAYDYNLFNPKKVIEEALEAI